MDALTYCLPWLAPLAGLICCSAFFSGSEVALFYMSPSDRRAFAKGNRAQQQAVGLLEDPDRLLTAVLFWNLVINIVYFAISSMVSLKLEQRGETTGAGVLAFGSLLAIIIFGESIPKTVALLQTRFFAALVGFPLSAAVRVVDPLIPAFGAIVLASRRLLWPSFEAEPYLHLDDLERAIDLSTSDSDLAAQEHRMLQNIVALSNIRADELMRPRTQCLSFAPPVALADLKGKLPPSGYILVTEKESDDIAAAIPVQRMATLPTTNLQTLAEPIVYVPWCTSAAAVFEAMRKKNRRVAAVVHEFGETIGIITFDDIVASLFAVDRARTDRLLHVTPIEQTGEDRWRINGMTNLRRVAKHLKVQFPETRGVTVSGLMQEFLQTFPTPGDEIAFGRYLWRVLEVGPRGDMTVELHPNPAAEENA